MLKIKVSFTEESQDAAYRELDRLSRAYQGAKLKRPKKDPETNIWRGYIEIKEPPQNGPTH